MDEMSGSEYMASHRVSAVTPVRLAVWSHSTCRGNKFMFSRDGLDSTLVASLIFLCTHAHAHTQQPQLALPHSKPGMNFRGARKSLRYAGRTHSVGLV
jgi:hypothetical protein